MKSVASLLGGSSELPLPRRMSAADVLQHVGVLPCLQPERALLKYMGFGVRAVSLTFNNLNIIVSGSSDFPMLSSKQGYLTIYALRMLFTFLLVTSGSDNLDIKQNIGTKVPCVSVF